jgi:hypothetical protein
MPIPVTVITPTGDRPECLRLSERWMARQTVQPAQWLVIDDGETPTACTMGQRHVRRQRHELDPIHTLPQNILAAVPLVEHDKVIIWEDDDAYVDPGYLATVAAWLDHDDMVGEGQAIYIHPRRQWYRQHTNMTHCSFAATAFNLPVVRKLLEAICRLGDGPMIDTELWYSFEGRKRVYPAKPMIVQLKGMPGRKSYLAPHREPEGYEPDPGNAKLRELLGAGADNVLALFKDEPCPA